MKALLKAFWGGGSGYVYLLGGAFLAFVWGYVKYLEHKVDDLSEALSIAVAESHAKGAVVDSKTRQQIRTNENQKELSNVETEINSSDSPLIYTYEWLRNKRANEADNPDP